MFFPPPRLGSSDSRFFSLPDVLHHPLHPVPHALPGGGTARLDLPDPILKRADYVDNYQIITDDDTSSCQRGIRHQRKQHLDSVKRHSFCHLGRGGRPDQVLLVGVHQDWHPLQLLFAQQLLQRGGGELE